DAGVIGHSRVGDEHLVEQGPTGHLPQRTYLDGVTLVHVEGEVTDAAVLGDIGISAREEHAEVGRLPARRPYLLTVDHPLVAILDGARLQPGQVGAGTG